MLNAVRHGRVTAEIAGRLNDDGRPSRADGWRDHARDDQRAP